MPIVITDDDAVRLLSIPEAIEAMAVAFRDLAEGRAVNPPRLRYDIASPDPARRYYANIHAGAVGTYKVACVRAGSHLLAADNDPKRRNRVHPDPVNWTLIILYDLGTGEPLAFMHETRAICAVRPIRRVQVFSPNPQHRAAFIARLANEPFETVAVADAQAVVRGADIVCCATNARVPVLEGA
jgi:ornithine cyclodeaminase/alanine dehydrogenase-like protein (mu-crystallin family)